MVFFTLGYAIIWILILGYTAVVHKQQSKLEKQILVLEEILKERVQKTES